ncbi:MAG: apolipoprotein N-acyltransferase, partial [Cyanobacteria bacterium REEB65]|nr:apolipoprotein N-acyltransferase [Cyanobacteria bacterium REEB65]
YKDTAAPQQHFAQSILRAVENRRFLVRAANTGVSGVIDPYGRVLVRSQTFVPAVETAMVAPMTVLTPYTRFGDWPIALAGGIGLAGLVGMLLRRKAS